MIKNSILKYLLNKGIESITENEFFNILDSREHFALLDTETRNKLDSYLDPSLIPQEYKHGKDYYRSFPKFEYIEKLPDNHLLVRDTKLGK